jgi:hypothetical protein
VGAIIYFLSVGFVLSLSLKLWSEEHQWTRKDWVVHAISYAILLADAIYLYHINFGQGGRGYETFLMHASAILALTLTVLELPMRFECESCSEGSDEEDVGDESRACQKETPMEHPFSALQQLLTKDQEV